MTHILTNLEQQSADTSPSAWFVTWQFLLEAEDAFCSSRQHKRERLVTVVFGAACIQIRLLT